MDQLPIFFNVKDRCVAVIGGGISAAGKAEMAMRAGAQVKVFAAQLCEEFQEIKADARFRFVPREPLAQDLDGCALLYCASENMKQNRKVHAIAREARIPCNVVDMPELCDFTMPSIVDRSPVVIAISTAGTSPILGRMIKARLETLLPAAYGRVAAFVGRYRKRVGSALKDFHQRRRFWERISRGRSSIWYSPAIRPKRSRSSMLNSMPPPAAPSIVNRAKCISSAQARATPTC